ncbi:MAG: hypothetical protein ACR2G5_01570 [Pyrinomonadaceae bacterium]
MEPLIVVLVIVLVVAVVLGLALYIYVTGTRKYQEVHYQSVVYFEPRNLSILFSHYVPSISCIRSSRRLAIRTSILVIVQLFQASISCAALRNR